MSGCLACGLEHSGPGLQCYQCQRIERGIGVPEAARGCVELPRSATEPHALPETAVPQRNAAQGAPVRSEAEIQAEIVAWLKLHGWDVTVTSAHTHAKGVTAGTPDLYIRRTDWAVPFWIEVKRPGGKVSKAQIEWHDAERRCGGTVIVAYGIQDVQQLA